MKRVWIAALLTGCLQTAAWAQDDTAEEAPDPAIARLDSKAGDVIEKLPADLQPRFLQLQDAWRAAFERACPARPLSPSCEARLEARIALLRDTWFAWQEAPWIDRWLKPAQRHLSKVRAALKSATPSGESNTLEADQRRWEAQTALSCRKDEADRARQTLFGRDRRVRNRVCQARAIQERAFELDQRLSARRPPPSWPSNPECFDWTDDITTIKAATLDTDQGGSGLQGGTAKLSPNPQGATLQLFLDGYDAHTCEATLDFHKVVQGLTVRYVAQPESMDGGTCQVELKRWSHHLTLEGEFTACQSCGHRVDWPRVIPMWGGTACR
jgi:hypothetical protein